MGNWNGGYSGESDNGAWSILIGGDGKISGTIISLVNRKEYIISGTVDKQGKTEMKSEETPGLFFSGMLNADTAVAFGNWIDTREEPPHGGTWNGMKSFA